MSLHYVCDGCAAIGPEVGVGQDRDIYGRPAPFPPRGWIAIEVMLGERSDTDGLWPGLTVSALCCSRRCATNSIDTRIGDDPRWQ